MSSRALSVKNLCKSYTIAHQAKRHTTLGEALIDRIRHPFAREPRETFEALKDVNFDIERGEVVGIIGRNGAGKSTLLKVLSRITEPTSGRIELYGRVGSLLEVGTGFHPELTGRENIYLNGHILGMRRSEIARQFDAIVDFAGVEKFLDTPVKRYSSGMYVRLAFAVAAHLESEILIVDEVLAVGDAEFQTKCLGKMKDVAGSGRTVLFVSHNMQAVRTLCTLAIYMDSGQLKIAGSVDDCIQVYTRGITSTHAASWRAAGSSGKPLSLSSIDLVLSGVQPKLTLGVRVTTRSESDHPSAFVAVDILDQAGTPLMQAIPTFERFISSHRSGSAFQVDIDLPPMVPSTYSVGVWVGSHNTETMDYQANRVFFTIDTSPSAGRTFPHTPSYNGYVVPFSRLSGLEES